MKRLLQLIHLLDKPQKKSLKCFAIVCMFAPAADLLGVSMMIPLLQNALNSGATNKIIVQSAALAFVLLLTGGFELVRGRCSAALVTDIAHGWSVKLYELYGIEELEDHNKKTPMQAVSGARTDPVVCAETIPSYFSLAVDILTTLVYALTMVYMAGYVGVISCILIAVIMAAIFYNSRFHATRYGEKRRQLEIRAGGMVSTMFGAYKEIRIDSRRGNLLEKYRRVSEDCAKVQKDYAFTKKLQGIILRNLMQSALFFALAGALALGVDMSGILPDMVIFIALLTRILPVSKRIVETLTGLQYALKYYEALCAALCRYTELKREQAGRLLLREKQVTLTQGIRVEHLSFHYSGGKQIFQDASIEILAGCSTAIIGPSGAGKTTLLDLLLGLLHPQEGHIWYDDFDLVDGRDGQGACRADIGTVVSYIPQIIYLNDETVRGNVTFMAGEDGQSEERIVECLKYARIWEEVQELPNGLDTLIGQNGSSISGGQRQRIALARALYKQSEILIMDEATAALDIDTERAVINSIRHMKGYKTLLVVTHRLSLAEECEHIYKLENKQLVKVR